LSKKFSEIYSERHVDEVAYQTGFIKRRRKLNPLSFLDTLLFNKQDNESVSLNDYSVSLQVRHDLQIRKQSIDERFNEGSVAFIKKLLDEQLEKQLGDALKPVCFNRFSSVKIKDSTRFELSDSLKDAYPGSGGAASEAGVHMQFEFDLKNGRTSEIKINDARYQDVSEAEASVSEVEEGSLIIRDLGYFSTKVFDKIANDRKAYFISRVPPRVKIFTWKGGRLEPLDLGKEYQSLKQKGVACKELQAYIGANQKVPVRLLIELFPELEVEKRMRKANREAEKKGRILSKEYKAYASLGLFVTNVPDKWIKSAYIRKIYQLRWQIELRFKCWKGLCRIHLLKKMKLHRLNTCLYACLLYILINWEISMLLVAQYWKTTSRMLSVYKCFKAIIQTANLLREVLFRGLKRLQNYFKLIEHIDPRNLWLESRKGRLHLEEILLTNMEK
jgi:hypothetical protein